MLKTVRDCTAQMELASEIPARPRPSIAIFLTDNCELQVMPFHSLKQGSEVVFQSKSESVGCLPLPS